MQNSSFDVRLSYLTLVTVSAIAVVVVVVVVVVVRVWGEYKGSIEHPLYLSVSTVGLHIMLPPPVSLMMP